MRNVFIFAIMVLLTLSCTKKESAKPTGGTPTGNYHFIKYWQADTLRSIELVITIGRTDTLFAFKSGDTSYVTYHSNKLYLFYAENADWNKNDSFGGYLNVYMSPVCFDTASKWSMATVLPFAYYDDSHHGYIYGKESIIISNQYPHFDTAYNNMYFHF